MASSRLSLLPHATHTWFGPLGVAIQAPDPAPAATSMTRIVVQPDMAAMQCSG